jgi:hypothetical protein
MADEQNRALSKRIETLEIVLGALMAVFLEDRPDQRTPLLASIELLRTNPRYSSPDRQAAIDEAIKYLKGTMPTYH